MRKVSPLLQIYIYAYVRDYLLVEAGVDLLITMGRIVSHLRIVISGLRGKLVTLSVERSADRFVNKPTDALGS